MLHHITSHYITLRHVTSHYITLHHITSCYIKHRQARQEGIRHSILVRRSHSQWHQLQLIRMRCHTLFGLCAVGVVHDHAPCEPRSHGLLSDQFHLIRVLRVHLEHCLCPSHLQGSTRADGGGVVLPLSYHPSPDARGACYSWCTTR